MKGPYYRKVWFFWGGNIFINDSINESVKEVDRKIDNITANVLESKNVNR